MENTKHIERRKQSERGTRARYKAAHDAAFYAEALSDENRVSRCIACGAEKHARSFYRNPSKPHGFANQCKDCRRAIDIQHSKTRDYSTEWRKKAYGLSSREYTGMLEAQGGLCAICGNPPQAGGVLAVDHCHAGGHVRGLLCRGCNTGLGHFRDNPELLRKAVDYLSGL